MRRKTALATSAVLAALAISTAPAYAELINGSLPAEAYGWTGPNSIFGLFASLVQLIISIATILAAMFFMYAGWLYISSAGDTAKIERAHKIFKDVGWGFLLLLTAWLIVVTILESLGAKTWLLNFFGR